jgi:integrase
LKILRTAFNRARRQGSLGTNPCEAVDFPKGEAQVREPFTAREVGLLLQKAPKEWRTAILLGFYAGLRLGDAVNLDWKSVDLKKGMLTFKAQKTYKSPHPIKQTRKLKYDKPPAKLTKAMLLKASGPRIFPKI